MTAPLADALRDARAHVADARGALGRLEHVGHLPRPVVALYARAHDALGQLAWELDQRIERHERAEQGGAAGPWYLLEQAVDQWARIAGYPDTDAGFRRAQGELVALAGELEDRGPRETDEAGRQLYRAGRTRKQVRLVVDPREQSRHGDLPVLLWVGTSRPPGWCWDGKRREPGTTQGAATDRRRRDRG